MHHFVYQTLSVPYVDGRFFILQQYVVRRTIAAEYQQGSLQPFWHRVFLPWKNLTKVMVFHSSSQHTAPIGVLPPRSLFFQFPWLLRSVDELPSLTENTDTASPQIDRREDRGNCCTSLHSRTSGRKQVLEGTSIPEGPANEQCTNDAGRLKKQMRYEGDW